MPLTGVLSKITGSPLQGDESSLQGSATRCTGLSEATLLENEAFSDQMEEEVIFSNP
jgi:hypothetical protein